ncbi:MAG TPA: ferric reductase-like transmembrane domain-containing protein, partial [Microthrixaceae bacterium]|nr:ferric reductase-like transmembrane domain-containing protein [Microthrixaceae bacterium]
MNPQFWWYVTRASGLAAALLIAATLIWGLLITTHLIDRRGMPAWLTDLHRGLGGLSVVFIAIHLGSLVADNYIHFSWKELFVPFASTYRAGGVAWGIAALWGMVLVEGSSLLVRRRKKHGWWRRIHYLSFPSGVLVAVHMMTAGSDAGSRPLRLIALGILGVLIYLITYRLLGGSERPGTKHANPPERKPGGTPPAVGVDVGGGIP